MSGVASNFESRPRKVMPSSEVCRPWSMTNACTSSTSARSTETSLSFTAAARAGPLAVVTV